jgi:hypothetical protein
MTNIPAVAADGSHITLGSADVAGLRSALRGERWRGVALPFQGYFMAGVREWPTRAG